MDPVAKFIHEMNRDAYKLNKNIIGETNTMRKVPLSEGIYQKTPSVQQVPVQQPVQQIPAQQPVQQVPVQQPVQQFATGLSEEQLKQFLDKMSSMEKKIDRFFNLIEKRVVKGAKEINIRIKLNDTNENTDTEQA